LGRPTLEESITLPYKNLLPNAGVLSGVDYLQEIDALGRQPYTDFLFFANKIDFASQLKLLRTFNVKHLLSFRPLAEKEIILVGHFPEYFSWLYQIEGTMPRAYVVNKTIVEKDSKQVLRLLSSDGFDPKRDVVLNEEIPLPLGVHLKATAKIVRYDNTTVTITTSADSEAVLVLADSYYPGWKAFVDGREQVIRRANLFFRAVLLPAGNHTVEFRYEPRSFAIGLLVSATTVVALIVTTSVFALRTREKLFQNPTLA
jgi:hypothetical protein